MTIDPKPILDGLGAVFAFLAAAAWFRAASAPIPGATPSVYADVEFISRMNSFNKRVLLGATWNRRAATLAGLSALCSAISWIVAVIGL